MTAAPGASDEELARRARAGDAPAFEALVHRYQDRVYRLSRRLTGNTADAEEAVQDTFLRVFRRLGSFHAEARFSTWLYRVAANSALMVARSRWRRRSEPLDPYLPRFDAAGRHRRTGASLARPARAEELIDRRRLAARALGALQRLPPLYRAPFVLRDLEELPTAEVAAVLGLTAATVRQRVHRARLLVRGYLGHLVGVSHDSGHDLPPRRGAAVGLHGRPHAGPRAARAGEPREGLRPLPRLRPILRGHARHRARRYGVSPAAAGRAGAGAAPRLRHQLPRRYESSTANTAASARGPLTSALTDIQ